MSESFPHEVEQFHSAVRRLPGIVEIDTSVDELKPIALEHLSLPCYGDLPHMCLRRTGGSLRDEVWVHPEIVFKNTCAGWRSLEFLAWWVREQSRAGEIVQMRPLAQPPVAIDPEGGQHVQLGQTLKFVIDLFLPLPGGDVGPALEKLQSYARSLHECIDFHSRALLAKTGD